MAIRVALHHRTCYRYDRHVTLYPQVVRLRPAPHCRTPVTSYSLVVRPAKHFINWQQDPQGNHLARLVFPDKTDHFELEVDLVAELSVINPFDFFLEASCERFPFRYESWLEQELAPYRVQLPSGPRFEEFVARAPRGGGRTVDFLVELNRYVHEQVEYVIRLEPGVQSPDETLSLRRGSCRDSAWLLAQLARRLGLAARFVSGYLIQLKADVRPLDGPPGPPADFTDLHAWTEVYLPGAGWVGLDPTSGLLTAEGHLPLAATPDPASAAPVAGAVEPCEARFEFSMRVDRVHEDPRVTKPYSEEQWTEIQALGHRVDADLEAGAVRLTMGGEPTFVSADDMEGAEWNTAALGPVKRRLAGQLVKRLQRRFAPGALLHYGQGKWYPGEQLPRWALGCYWRADGQPIWNRHDLIADDEQDFRHGSPEAQSFVAELAARLRVGGEHILPGYEDAWYYLWRERRLPTNVDPLDARLDDELERARLARVFERGLGSVVGYALPLAGWFDGRQTHWQSGPWFLRREHMFLIPGDSPMGYRLPLDSLPWVAPADYPHVGERDPLEPRGPLPPPGRNGHHADRNGHGGVALGAARARARLVAQYAGIAAGGTVGLDLDAEPPPYEYPEPLVRESLLAGQSARSVVRTALCVEPRQGKLHIFMPPTRQVEEYLDLAAALEATAERLQMPVVLEGYPPPRDHRLRMFRVTPDPGVIEVNLQPANSWDELVEHTTVLYDEARQTRLSTEKFMLDGRHTGTGGGNHVVLGGATPADSPFLRRPDVLRSLLAYWHNHPSLSYLFSGLFIGPTSQAPRVDEGRYENAHELETAFEQIPDAGGVPPWLVDRVFRHVLVDVTGNTHRTEFCIDKLYSPDTAGGRLGLVEFRGFEMPPHARMSLAQQLLLRAAVAAFWRQPYRGKLIRWGTTLHDRFMLPHFLAEDFRDVLGDLDAAGYAFDQDWFAPHFEFRFPACGRVVYRGIELELRQAAEPWHVLGEEPSLGGAVRYVDSSVERVQVRVRGLTDPRHLVTCNGRRVPLHPTGVAGEYVAGVRYRAWQPPSCLHPTIGVHSPLVFDVLDTWAGRSIGGCTWHVAHPGGRAFDRFPVNAYEAESRRVARFFAMGHTPGRAPTPVAELNPEYPLTLDLRRAPPRAVLGAEPAVHG